MLDEKLALVLESSADEIERGHARLLLHAWLGGGGEDEADEIGQVWRDQGRARLVQNFLEDLECEAQRVFITRLSGSPA